MQQTFPATARLTRRPGTRFDSFSHGYNGRVKQVQRPAKRPVTKIDVTRAERLLKRGAQLVDVLPASIYAQEHLPGAVSRPLESMTRESVSDLDRHRPLIVYCFDQHCDLSARASCRLHQLGFSEVYDLVGGRAAWTVLGLATEGQIGDRRRVAQYVVDAPTVAIGATVADVADVVVPGRPTAGVGDGDVLLGSVSAIARRLPPDTPVEQMMVTAPATVRPDGRVEDVIAQLRKDHLDHVYVTTARGVLIGLLVEAETHV